MIVICHPTVSMDFQFAAIPSLADVLYELFPVSRGFKQVFSGIAAMHNMVKSSRGESTSEIEENTLEDLQMYQSIC